MMLGVSMAMIRGMWVLCWLYLGVAPLLAATCLTDGPMVYPDDDWLAASPQSRGVNAVGLQKSLDYLGANAGGVGTDEMVIIRDGYLIWQGPGADNVHEIYSCTKTFTSTAMGLLITDGTITADDFAVEYLPSLDDRYPQYARIRLSHLAAMTSGYDSVMGDGWTLYGKDPAKYREHVLSYTVPGPTVCRRHVVQIPRSWCTSAGLDTDPHSSTAA